MKYSAVTINCMQHAPYLHDIAESEKAKEQIKLIRAWCSCLDRETE